MRDLQVNARFKILLPCRADGKHNMADGLHRMPAIIPTNVEPYQKATQVSLCVILLNVKTIHSKNRRNWITSNLDIMVIIIFYISCKKKFRLFKVYKHITHTTMWIQVLLSQQTHTY